MADQNQNQIPGSLRTLKTDLALIKSNPQDRLQQAGNFVQARPDINSNAVSTNTIDTKLTVEKKDIPAGNIDAKTQSNYSWSNMNIAPAPAPAPAINPSNSLDSQSKISIPTKSGFSALDDSIDLPLDNNLVNKIPASNPTNTQTVTSPATQLDINGFNLQENVKEVNSKPSAKRLISLITVFALLGLIGGGVYLYFNIDKKNDTNITTNTDVITDADTSTDDSSDAEPSSNFNSPLTQNSEVNISFIDSESIRVTASSVLTDKSDALIKLNLTKNNNPVSLIDIADVLGITIPSIETIKNYGLYAYNQQGVYKLVAVLELASDQNTKTFVDNWSNFIPRDLSGFSINIPSRIVNDPQIKKSTITNNSGKIFENYYYNYTSPTDSIDVSSYQNYILMASSQNSMRYILDQIK
jgi:hypothetical protein